MKRLITLAIALMLLFSAAVAEEDEYVTLIPPMPAQAVFTFDANATTGYNWLCSIKNAGVVELAGDEYVKSETGLLGAGGESVFTLNAIEAGEAIVEFIYARDWEADAIERHVYLLIVLEDGTMEARALDGIAPLTGNVISLEDGKALISTETNGDVLCLFPADMELPVMDEQVKIWFNGVMTMSLPGQINVLAWEAIPPEKARG